jgi:hypothetical protein
MGKKKRTGGFEENDRDLFGDVGSLSGKDFETSDDSEDLFFGSDDGEDAESEDKAADKGNKGMSDEDAAKHIAELLSGLFEAAGHAGAKQKAEVSKASDSDAEIDAMVSKAAAKVGKALKTAKRGAEVGKKGLETAAEGVTESEAFKKLIDSVYRAMEVAKVGADKVKDAVKREDKGAEFDFEDFDTVRTESEPLDSDNPLATLGFYELSKEGGASEVLNEALTALNEKYRGLSGTVIEEALLAALSADTESRLNGKVVETENRLLSYRVRSLERISTELREAVSGCALTPNEYVELKEKVDNLDKQIEGLREINAEFTRLGKKSR